MKKTNLRSIISIATALIFCLAVLVSCNGKTPVNNANDGVGGVLCLKVNPEIAITYDADGNVTNVSARNDDASKIIADYTGYEGKTCKTVVSELVTAIGDAGYFVEEIEGERRQITIEIETGSTLPSGTFLDDVANEVRNCVNSNNWTNPVDVKGESDYGITDYIDTDYGPDNDGVTDYTDYGTTAAPNTVAPVAGATDYIDTDYGPGSDGVTDYTDYGTTAVTTASLVAGATDYNDTDYGPGNDGVTDYVDTDYGPGNDGVTDYVDTDYGPGNDGVTDYVDTDYGNSNYDDGDSRYDD